MHAVLCMYYVNTPFFKEGRYESGRVVEADTINIFKN